MQRDDNYMGLETQILMAACCGDERHPAGVGCQSLTPGSCILI